MGQSLWDQSTTPSSNLDISGVGIQENCPAGNMNDALRAFAAQVKGALVAVTASGTNTVTATLAPAPAAYVTGMSVHLIAGGTNTGATTLNLNGLGAKAVTVESPSGPAALVGGEMVNGETYRLVYDGTQFQLTNPTPQEGSFTATLAGGTTAGTFTASNQLGRYIRNGNLVTAWFRVTGTLNGAAGTAVINGLPFTSSNIGSLETTGGIAFVSNVTLTSGYSQFCLRLSPNTAQIKLTQSGSNVAFSDVPVSSLGSGTDIAGQVTFRIN
jgi:hypothetical protein